MRRPAVDRAPGTGKALVEIIRSESSDIGCGEIDVHVTTPQQSRNLGLGTLDVAFSLRPCRCVDKKEQALGARRDPPVRAVLRTNVHGRNVMNPFIVEQRPELGRIVVSEEDRVMIQGEIDLRRQTPGNCR